MKRFLTLLGLHALAGVSIAQAQTPVKAAAAGPSIQIEDSIRITPESWRDNVFKINKSQVPTGILLEYSLFPFIATKYDGVNNDDDTLSSGGQVFQLHSILKSSIINGNAVLPNTDSLYELAQDQAVDATMPLTFLYQTYNTLSPTAYSRGLLTTTADGISIIDVANRTASPYDQREVFAFQPFRTSLLTFGNINFTLPAALWQMQGITSVSVDFGDGAGFRTISKGGSASVHYATTGTKVLTAQITTSGGTRIAKSTFTYSRPEYFSTPDFTWTVTATPVYTSVNQYLGTSSLSAKSDMSILAGVLGARVSVENGCDRVFDKPVIILEGFDPDGSLDMQTLKDRFKHWDFKDKLRDYGYDFVYVEFTKNADFIENNAKVLEEVIKKVNSSKANNNYKSTVIGYSMGGLIARWCLKDMEDRGLDHRVANYISYDSPHQGANIPLGFQCLFLQFVKDVPFLKFSQGIVDLINAQRNPAGRQMLVMKPDMDAINAGSSSIGIIDELRIAFADRLVKKGYPRTTNNYAVAFGRGNNTSGTKNAGNGVQWNNFAGGTRLLKADIKHSFMYMQTSTFANPADGTTGYICNYRYQGATGRMILGVIPVLYNTLSKRDFRMTSQYCYDDAPGSYEMTQKEFGSRFNRFVAGEIALPTVDGHLGHNFVATASALDLQNQSYAAANYFQSGNMFFNIDQQIQNPRAEPGNTVSATYSPFKAIMTATSDCVGTGSDCQAEEYFDLNGTRIYPTNPSNWNHFHNMVYMRPQFAKFLTRKILGTLPSDDCDPSGAFCEGNPTITGVAHFCDAATYSVSGINNLKFTWSVSSNLRITAGEGTNSISVSRVSDGYGTVTATLLNDCGTTRTVTKNVHMGAPDDLLLHVYGPSLACPTAYNTYTAFTGGNCNRLIEQGVTTIEWGSSPAFDGITHNPVPDACSQIYDYSAKLKFREISGLAYSLRVRATNSCGTSQWSANTSVTVNTSGCGGGGGTTFNMTTTPNPASNDVFVDIEENTVSATNTVSKSTAAKAEDNKIIITDLMGNIKLTQKVAGNLKSFRINVSMLPEGNYILNVTHKGVSQGKQIIISH